MGKKAISKPFRSAKTEVKELKESRSAKLKASANRLAFTDTEFLLRKELRPVRLMLELMKPEITLRDEHIDSTIVVFGSARIHEYKTAKANLQIVKAALEKKPNSGKLQNQVKIAEKLLQRANSYNIARKLGKLISTACQKNRHLHFVIITGGGPGIMEAANRGAYDAKAKSIGLNIILPMEQAPNRYISPELNFEFHYFAMRKMHFLIRARALIAFPGGYGTFDELFEALTLLQTGKIKPMPVLLFDKEYWTKVVNFPALVEEGMISPEDLTLFQFVETPEEAWQAIRHFYQLKEEDLV